MQPHFAFWTCENCDKAVMKRDCFGNGLYCAINEKNLNTTGQDILYEDLRQKCLHDTLLESGKENLWWSYIQEFHQACYNEVTEACSKNAHDTLGLNFKATQDCVKKSFFGSGEKYMQKNKVFEEEKDYYQKYGPSFFPGLVINNRTYMGVLDPENAFESVCAGFKNVPKECKTHKVGSDTANGISISKLILIIFGVILLNVVLLLCYRRYAKKEVSDQMQMHINSAVSQYFALQD